MSFAVRSKDSEAGQMLYISKCQELANFYLGFSGWTSAIQRLEEDTDVCGQLSPTAPLVRFFCVVELSFPQHNLTTQGVGAWEESFCAQGQFLPTTTTITIVESILIRLRGLFCT